MQVEQKTSQWYKNISFDDQVKFLTLSLIKPSHNFLDDSSHQLIYAGAIVLHLYLLCTKRQNKSAYI